MEFSTLLIFFSGILCGYIFFTLYRKYRLQSVEQISKELLQQAEASGKKIEDQAKELMLRTNFECQMHKQEFERTKAVEKERLQAKDEKIELEKKQLLAPMVLLMPQLKPCLQVALH